MPELPEVEVVRRGLAAHVVGREIGKVKVLHPRAVRRHEAGERDFEKRLAGRRIERVSRRGKYLWLELDGGEQAVLAHLGMSGQLLVQDKKIPAEKHLRVRFTFVDGGGELRFVDQRIFGGLSVTDLGVVDGTVVPDEVAHIGRDPMDEEFDFASVVRKIRAKNSEIKRVLLDQNIVSGIGNIYADEALWRAKLHGTRPASSLTPKKISEVVTAAKTVMAEALAVGGTSFDSLYVNVNGESGYFARGLNAYGREHEPCPRCGTPITREPFMNRSSYSCPKCQKPT